MPTRLDILKTYKLFIDGKFPRSESGRTTPIAPPPVADTPKGAKSRAPRTPTDAPPALLAHVARASRKDLRDAVEAARRAQPAWAGATAYNRGQILYRMAEMMEGKAAEFAHAIAELAPHADAPKRSSRPSTASRSTKRSAAATAAHPTPHDEVAAAIDRLVCFAGWADKYSQVLGCNNPVAGPYYNFTVPEPTGVVAVVAPDERPLLALISLLAPPLCAGNAIVALASQTNPIPAAILAEVCATSDVPPGVINILTGERPELLPHIATHRDIDAVHAALADPAESRTLREGVAENLKRVVIRKSAPAPDALDWFDADRCHSPWWIEPFVEMKTIWHPAAT